MSRAKAQLKPTLNSIMVTKQ